MQGDRLEELEEAAQEEGVVQGDEDDYEEDEVQGTADESPEAVNAGQRRGLSMEAFQSLSGDTLAKFSLPPGSLPPRGLLHKLLAKLTSPASSSYLGSQPGGGMGSLYWAGLWVGAGRSAAGGEGGPGIDSGPLGEGGPAPREIDSGPLTWAS